MARRPGIFPTFFLSGFECSSFRWKDRGRRDLVAETRHRGHGREDYGLLRDLGIAVAREGVPWPMADRGGGRYDFSLVDPLIDAMNVAKIFPVWDLCHYGYPDDADRFARYARAAAEYVTARVRGPHVFTPINEITPMEPNDQYLCIVPARDPVSLDTNRVFLPFEGDSTLSIVLSKAFLLAADDTIMDPTIVRQIALRR